MGPDNAEEGDMVATRTTDYDEETQTPTNAQVPPPRQIQDQAPPPPPPNTTQDPRRTETNEPETRAETEPETRNVIQARNDTNVQRLTALKLDDKPLLNIGVEIHLLPKYTKSLEKYRQDTLENYLKFIKQLETTIKKLSITSNNRCSLNDILNEKYELSETSRMILTLILDDTLEGVAATTTSHHRSRDDFIACLRTLKAAWPQESENTKSTTIRMQLTNTKMDPNETIQQYNQKYLTLFNEALRLGRAIDGPIAVDDYLHSLPLDDPMIRSSIQNIRLRGDVTSIAKAMDLVSLQILAINPDGVLKTKTETVYTVEAGGTRGKPYRLQKGDCRSCGYNHPPRRCPAHKKTCNYCGIENHFSSVCNKRISDEKKREGNGVEESKLVQSKDDSEEVKQVKEEYDNNEEEKAMRFKSFVGKIADTYVEEVNSTTKLELDNIGVDSMCSITILNKEDYFIHWNDYTRTLRGFDNSELTGVRSGKASITLVDQYGKNAMNILVEAAYVPEADNLVSMYEVANADIKLNLHKDKPSLRLGEATIPLQWNNKLLTNCYLKRFEKVNMVTYNTLHSRLGHINPAAMKKTINLEPPKDFDCITCTQMNRRNYLPKLSEYTVRERNQLNPWEHLSMDIMHGPKDRLGITTYMVLVDIKTRLAVLSPIKELTAANAAMKLRELMIQVQAKPKQITTDRGGCFTGKEFKHFCDMNGINLIYCPPNQHANNPFAERIIGTLRKKALALLNAGRLNFHFFGDALIHATLLYNRTFHAGIEGIPFELLNNRKLEPNFVDGLRMFGSTVFYEGDTGLYIGQCPHSTSGTAKIFTKRKTVIRRSILHCTFDETLLSRNLIRDLELYFLFYGDLLHLDTEEDTIDKLNLNKKTDTINTVQDELKDPKHLKDIMGRPDTEAWRESALKELKGLVDKGTFKVIDRSQVPKDSRYYLRDMFSLPKETERRSLGWLSVDINSFLLYLALIIRVQLLVA